MTFQWVYPISIHGFPDVGCVCVCVCGERSEPLVTLELLFVLYQLTEMGGNFESWVKTDSADTVGRRERGR